jgi:hypothetical protein
MSCIKPGTVGPPPPRSYLNFGRSNASNAVQVSTVFLKSLALTEEESFVDLLKALSIEMDLPESCVIR